jgi:hypothetical protein
VRTAWRMPGSAERSSAMWLKCWADSGCSRRTAATTDTASLFRARSQGTILSWALHWSQAPSQVHMVWAASRCAYLASWRRRLQISALKERFILAGVFGSWHEADRLGLGRASV